jgi:hypothetical protein
VRGVVRFLSGWCKNCQLLELNRAIFDANFSSEVLTLIVSFGFPNTERLGSLVCCAEENYDKI